MPDQPDEVYLVLGAGIVLAAYRRSDSATLHARCITGAVAVGPVAVLDAVPQAILDDIQVEEDGWDDDDTPVVDPPTGMVGSPDGRGRRST